MLARYFFRRAQQLRTDPCPHVAETLHILGQLRLPLLFDLISANERAYGVEGGAVRDRHLRRRRDGRRAKEQKSEKGKDWSHGPVPNGAHGRRRSHYAFTVAR